MEDEGRRNLEDAVALLPTPTPTPTVTDMGRGKSIEQWDEWTARMQVEHGNGNGHGPSLEIEAQRLLPTPTRSASQGAWAGGEGGPNLQHAVTIDWGKYGPAIRRWEQLTRLAPPPTITGAKGQPKLNPAFTEWMQGYPAGWCHGLTDNQQLKAYGNSVCPQQGAAAVALLEDAHRAEAVA